MRFSRRSFLAAAVQPPKRPNILLLLADNWAYPHASAYGDPVVRTPVFDQLARDGVLFTHAFAPVPSCSPSRSSLLTGQPAHRLGEAASLYGPLAPSHRIYPNLLETAGYAAGFSGKGWGPGNFGGRNPAGAQYDSLKAMLDQNPGKPFCFWFGSHDPHVPWDRGRAAKASMDPARVAVPPHLPDRPEVRDDILNYYCEVQQFDAECGEILELLRQRGLLDNTLVIMTSDNGWQMPRGLANCHDLGVRIPLAIRWPGRVRQGHVAQEFVKIDDLFPAILEAAGVKAEPVTAKSLWPLLNGKRDPSRDHVFVERERHANVRRGDLSYPVRGLRTREYLYLRNLAPDRHPAGDPELYWAVGPYGDVDPSQTKTLLTDPARREELRKYFEYSFGKRPAEELYDLRRDPGQIDNAAAKPGYAKIKAGLSRRVEAWMKETGDPRASGWTDFFDKAPYSGARARPNAKKK